MKARARAGHGASSSAGAARGRGRRPRQRPGGDALDGLERVGGVPLHDLRARPAQLPEREAHQGHGGRNGEGRLPRRGLHDRVDRRLLAAAGALVPDPSRWTNGLKAVADYVHSQGLQLGLYARWYVSDFERYVCKHYGRITCNV